VADLEHELDELYQLPLTEFTSARNDLATRLKAEGRAGESDDVKGLRKPSVAVWLVNRLARERELDVQRLRKAGEAVAKGQIDATAGRSSDAFLEARQEEQRALARLGEAAREIAAREQVGSAAVDRAVDTLRAASLSDEGRELLKRGRLTEELEAPGFEALAGLVAATPKRPTTPAKPKKDDRRGALKEARERLREVRAEERELVAAARKAAQAADRAEAEAASLRERAEEAKADATAAAERGAAAEAEVERLS
jgi:hypothetical protein